MMSRSVARLRPRHVDRREGAIEVGLGQIEVGELELRRRGRLEPRAGRPCAKR